MPLSHHSKTYRNGKAWNDLEYIQGASLYPVYTQGSGHPLAVWGWSGLRHAPLRCGPPKVGLENGERCHSSESRVTQLM